MADMFTELDRALRRLSPMRTSEDALDAKASDRRSVATERLDMLTTSDTDPAVESWAKVLAFPSVTVRESVHHGTFHHDRIVTLASLDADEIAGMVAECPYKVMHGPAVKAIADQLATTGKASHGWTDWEVC